MIKRDFGQVFKAPSKRIERSTQDAWSHLLELAPKLCLVTAQLGRHFEQLRDHCWIEKVGARGIQVGYRIEQYGTGSVEDRFVMIAVEFAAAEAAACCQPAGCVGFFFTRIRFRVPFDYLLIILASGSNSILLHSYRVRSANLEAPAR